MASVPNDAVVGTALDLDEDNLDAYYSARALGYVQDDDDVEDDVDRVIPVVVSTDRKRRFLYSDDEDHDGDYTYSTYTYGHDDDDDDFHTSTTSCRPRCPKRTTCTMVAQQEQPCGQFPEAILSSRPATAAHLPPRGNDACVVVVPVEDQQARLETATTAIQEQQSLPKQQRQHVTDTAALHSWKIQMEQEQQVQNELRAALLLSQQQLAVATAAASNGEVIMSQQRISLATLQRQQLEQRQRLLHIIESLLPQQQRLATVCPHTTEQLHDGDGGATADTSTTMGDDDDDDTVGSSHSRVDTWGYSLQQEQQEGATTPRTNAVVVTTAAVAQQEQQPLPQQQPDVGVVTAETTAATSRKTTAANHENTLREQQQQPPQPNQQQQQPPQPDQQQQQQQQQQLVNDNMDYISLQLVVQGQQLQPGDNIVTLPPQADGPTSVAHWTCRPSFPLAIVEDPNWLSEFYCFVRSELVEVFRAGGVTVQVPRFSIFDGQVGLRCRYCAHMDHRPRRATAFPMAVSQIYQAVTILVRHHFGRCAAIPEPLLKRFTALQAVPEPSAPKSRLYWANAAMKLGIVESLGEKRGLWITEASRAIGNTAPPFLTGLDRKWDDQKYSKIPLILPSDRSSVSEFLYLLISQLQPVRIKAFECTGNRRKVTGLGCRFCCEQRRMGRSRIFPFKLSSLPMKVIHMYDHMRRCNLCPTSIKIELARLSYIFDEPAQVKVEKYRLFYDRLWSRLEHLKNDNKATTKA